MYIYSTYKVYIVKLNVHCKDDIGINFTNLSDKFRICALYTNI